MTAGCVVCGAPIPVGRLARYDNARPPVPAEFRTCSVVHGNALVGSAIRRSGALTSPSAILAAVCTCWPGGCDEEYDDDDPRQCRYCRELDSEHPCPADVFAGDDA